MVNGLTIWLVDSCVAVLIALCWWSMLLCGGGITGCCGLMACGVDKGNNQGVMKLLVFLFFLFVSLISYDYL